MNYNNSIFKDTGFNFIQDELSSLSLFKENKLVFQELTPLPDINKIQLR